ncbi:hypoxanthine-guanine phosphoribosyltransferase [Candidatus Nitrosoglobus terrae]|uniref:Hypoxanthine-guanine phosphoribosyltransferase n=1 Tax=Candidatus Nitrosoglobus terrae TaxID=1630141 RepID=A0A1Q2SL40_9GAMM|nr:hypoxanthine-guanine phosphoribosyltransferase [Candidatus Nitrosoglobus terrae]BAW79827.1 hypoxanthine-guanine phosphoribosyltransferase [Candidatus Nitrosoglobus terrae]
MGDILQEIESVYKKADCLYTRPQVEAALDRLAQEITIKLSTYNPLLLCCMIGGIIPCGGLLPRLNFPLQLDYIHATRYQGEIEGGVLRWLYKPLTPLRGRTVLVIDDIFDEGHTLAAILEYCREEGATAYSAVLVDKLHDRKRDGLSADFIGLRAEDYYLFGYGLDYKGYLRNAPGVYALRRS